MHVGLKQDKKMNISKSYLRKIDNGESNCKIYETCECYCNVNPLPVEWIELFDEDAGKKEIQQKEKGNIMEYTPVCNLKELDYLNNSTPNSSRNSTPLRRNIISPHITSSVISLPKNQQFLQSMKITQNSFPKSKSYSVFNY